VLDEAAGSEADADFLIGLASLYASLGRKLRPQKDVGRGEGTGGVKPGRQAGRGHGH